MSAELARELGNSLCIAKSQEEWAGKVDLFRTAITTEMSQHLFLWVPLERAKFYNETEKTFGGLVRDRFPSALSEINEAGNCFAAGCFTASVFHLMRVMEVGLKATYRSLGMRFNPQLSWGQILTDWSPEGIKSNLAADAKVKANLDFYRDVRGTLASVKDSWRNSTMHFDRTYNEAEALEIMTAVRGFMSCVAKRIDEQGEVLPG